MEENPYLQNLNIPQAIELIRYGFKVKKNETQFISTLFVSQFLSFHSNFESLVVYTIQKIYTFVSTLKLSHLRQKYRGSPPPPVPDREEEYEDWYNMLPIRRKPLILQILYRVLTADTLTWPTPMTVEKSAQLYLHPDQGLLSATRRSMMPETHYKTLVLLEYIKGFVENDQVEYVHELWYKVYNFSRAEVSSSIPIFLVFLICNSRAPGQFM